MRARLPVVLVMTLALGACATRPPPAPPPAPPLAPPPGPSLAELKRQEDLKCLAETVYFEARGETEKGRQAVAWVVLNRTGHPKFPDSVCGVVRQGGEKPPCQFSWYCDGKPEVAKEQAAWVEAERVAALVYDRKVPDPTNGALYFHHVGVTPSWKDEFQQTARIDGHLYYKPLNISQI